MQEVADEEISLLNFFTPLTTLKAVIIIVFVGLAVFFNMLFNGFVWDDVIQIVNNTTTDSLQKIPSLFLTGQLGVFYRPLFFSTLTVMHAFFGSQVFFYHSIQLSIHIINVILIFFLFRKFIHKTIAILLSLVFLVEPINVEAVVYISSIADPLAVLFGLLSLRLMMREKETLSTVLLASFLLLLSLLTKEVGFVFLVIIILYRLLFYRKNKGFYSFSQFRHYFFIHSCVFSLPISFMLEEV